MNDEETRRLGRRAMMRRSLVVIATAPALGALGCGSGALECEPGPLDATQTATRNALHYVDHGQDAARHCVRCQLYTGSETACGTCSVVAGAIHPQGTCDSFVARS